MMNCVSVFQLSLRCPLYWSLAVNVFNGFQGSRGRRRWVTAGPPSLGECASPNTCTGPATPCFLLPALGLHLSAFIRRNSSALGRNRQGMV